MRFIRQYHWVLCCLFCKILCGQNTLEVHYYQPVAEEEELAGERKHYVLRCDARTSEFSLFTPVQWEADGLYQGSNRSKKEDCWIFKDHQHRQLLEFSVSLQGTNYCITDSLPAINWQVLQETRMLRQSILVRKARGSYGGRRYTAWFAPGIPIQDGPWKLAGLPGLILEAYDDDREVVFNFRLLKLRGPEVGPPSRTGRFVTPEAYTKIRKRELQQFLQYVVTRLQSSAPDLDLRLQFTYSFWEDPP